MPSICRMCRTFSSCSSYVAIDSPDSPEYPVWHFGLPGLSNLANVHPSSSAAGNLKRVSVGGTHFKYAILVAERFYRTLDFYGSVGCMDHCSFSRGKKKSTEAWRGRTEAKRME